MGSDSAGVDDQAVMVLRMQLLDPIRKLISASGLKQQNVARRLEPPMSQGNLSELLGGKPVRFPEWSIVWEIVCVCMQHIQRNNIDVGPNLSLRDRKWWEHRYSFVREIFEHLKETTSTTSPRSVRRGETIDRLDPRQLGVHGSIKVDGDLPILTPYVRRNHDQALRHTLNSSRGGVVVMLVGESCVGKTRAMYEAIRSCLPSWYVWQPVDAQELLTCASTVAPQTVIWLDEAQRYVHGSSQQNVVAAVHQLVRAPHSVVVLGSMWRKQWNDLTAPGEGADQDLRVRDLLLDAVRIDVPSDFDAPQDQDARTELAQQNDSRLALARSTAQNGRVVQVLAGGETLVRQFLSNRAEGNIFSSAVVLAAMDCRRLGMESILQSALLKEAAIGYLTPEQRVTPSLQAEDWFQSALEHASNPVRGVAAITAGRLTPGIGEPDHYRLHDYLDQYGRANRWAIPVPLELWQAMERHVTSPDDCWRLARAAERRLLLNFAEAFYVRCADAGNSAATLSVKEILATQGRDTKYTKLLGGWANAMSHLREEWVERTVAAGRIGDAIVKLSEWSADGDILRAKKLAELLIAHDRLAELLHYADRGGPGSHLRTAWAEAQLALGESDIALAQLQSWAAADDYQTEYFLLNKLIEYDAVDALRRWADSGNNTARRQLVKRLAERGAMGALVEAVRGWTDAGDTWWTTKVLDLLVEQGRFDELRNWAERTDANEVHRRFHELFLEHNRLDELAASLRHWGDNGDSWALHAWVDLLNSRDCDPDETIGVLRTWADRGELIASTTLRDILQEHERAEYFERWARDAKDQSIWTSWIIYARDHGRLDDAITFAKQRADEGDRYMLYWLARLVARKGNKAEALDLIDRQIHEGALEASHFAADHLIGDADMETLREKVARGNAAARLVLLERARQIDTEEAANILRFGLNADGSVAAPHAPGPDSPAGPRS